jgi:two-component system NtrC family sensor kinase
LKINSQLSQKLAAAPGGEARQSGAVASARFRLVPYFTVASLAMFLLVGVALGYFGSQQGQFFQDVQRKQIDFFGKVQESFAARHDEAARGDLLLIHEAGNVNLTRLFANALWEGTFAPFVAKAAQIPVDHCRAIANVKDEKDGKMKPPPEKKACFAEVGQKIMAFPEFASINAKVFASMKKSTVFKIKVFDLRGITVYSSEHGQMGEDKIDNAGWEGAARQGIPKSELTFRDKFSAFEGMVEKRDLISSYLPVLSPSSDEIVGVFEVYSDVTPFLGQIKQTAIELKKSAAANQSAVEAEAAVNQAEVDASGNQVLIIVSLLLLGLFCALFIIVRRAAGIIAQQTKDREHVQQQLAQSEKMASLGQMVAGVAHQLNTPLAFSQSNIQMVQMALDNYALPLKVAGGFCRLVKGAPADQVTVNVGRAREQIASIDEADLDLDMPKEMLSDTLNGIEQMRELVENLRDFTRLDRTKTALFDLNKALHNVVYIAKSVIPPTVEVLEEYGDLPKIECNVSQLNQVFLNLMNNAAQAIEADGKVTIRSSCENDGVRVDISDTGSGIPDEHLPHIWDSLYTTKAAGEGTGLGLTIAKSIVEEHGGRISVETRCGIDSGSTFTVWLPLKS